MDCSENCLGAENSTAHEPSKNAFHGVRMLFVINSDQGGGVEHLAASMSEHFSKLGAVPTSLVIYDGTEKSWFSKLRAVIRASAAFIRTPADVVITFQPTAAAVMGLFGPLIGRKVRIAHRSNMPDVTAWAPKWADLALGSIGGFTANISNSAATEAAYGGYPKSYRNRLRRIDHSVETRAPALDAAALRVKLAIPEGGRLAASISRLAPVKAVDVFIRTLKFLPGVVFAIGGEGADRQRLETVARECGVMERVRFVGRLNRQDVANLDAHCDIFIAPSRSETFGLSVAEAAIHGAPIIARNLPVMREVLAVPEPAGKTAPFFVAGAAAFVCSDDPEAWAAATKALLEAPDLAARRDAQQRSLTARFGEDTMLERYESLLREQLASQRFT